MHYDVNYVRRFKHDAPARGGRYVVSGSHRYVRIDEHVKVDLKAGADVAGADFVGGADAVDGHSGALDTADYFGGSPGVYKLIDSGPRNAPSGMKDESGHDNCSQVVEELSAGQQTRACHRRRRRDRA